MARRFGVHRWGAAKALIPLNRLFIWLTGSCHMTRLISISVDSMFATLLIVAAALAAQPARADGLEDLREALSKLRGTSVLKATVTAKVNATVKEDSEKPRVEMGSASLALEDGPQGLRLTYASDLLNKVSAERAARRKDSKAPAPIRSAMEELDYADLLSMTHAAPDLLRKLEGAQLKAERKDSWNGVPARVLSLELVVDKNQKYVKSSSSNLDVWIDADGRPLASKAQSNVSGRALMVISFEMKGTDDRVYSVLGDRLIVTRRDAANSGSGMGQSGDSKSTVTLQPAS
jgi:hypothetical protein